MYRHGQGDWGKFAGWGMNASNNESAMVARARRTRGWPLWAIVLALALPVVILGVGAAAAVAVYVASSSVSTPADVLDPYRRAALAKLADRHGSNARKIKHWGELQPDTNDGKYMIVEYEVFEDNSWLQLRRTFIFDRDGTLTGSL
jgi:hypothetical protein